MAMKTEVRDAMFALAGVVALWRYGWRGYLLVIVVMFVVIVGGAIASALWRKVT